MNNGAPSRTSTARYDNRRRAEQARENRDRILDAAIALLGERTTKLTIPELADRAGVSVPTVYRDFPTREVLLTEVAAEMSRRLGAPTPVGDVNAFVAALPTFCAYFAENAATIRAALQVDSLNEVLVQHGREGRDRDLEDVFSEVTHHLPAEEAGAVYALIRILAGSEAALAFFDRFEIPVEATATVVQWAISHLVVVLRDAQTRGEHSLIPADTTDHTRRTTTR